MINGNDRAESDSLNPYEPGQSLALPESRARVRFGAMHWFLLWGLVVLGIPFVVVPYTLLGVLIVSSSIFAMVRSAVYQWRGNQANLQLDNPYLHPTYPNFALASIGIGLLSVIAGTVCSMVTCTGFFLVESGFQDSVDPTALFVLGMSSMAIVGIFVSLLTCRVGLPSISRMQSEGMRFEQEGGNDEPDTRNGKS